ncbi:MAG TPA: cell division topological specificity factor MinE [Polyangia bacterium]
MTLMDFFRKRPKSANAAKDRLSVIFARERTTMRGGPDYLPQLQQELLAVLAKYEHIDLQNVSVKVDQSGGYDVLELNIVLPEDEEEAASSAPAARAKKAAAHA